MLDCRPIFDQRLRMGTDPGLSPVCPHSEVARLLDNLKAIDLCSEPIQHISSHPFVTPEA